MGHYALLGAGDGNLGSLQMKALPIFFSFDEGYVTPAAVTFESLLTNAKPGIFYELYVLHESIHPESQRKLIELVAKHGNASLSFISVTGVLESAGILFDDSSFCLGHDRGKFTKETLLRCLPTLIPEFAQYDRILYSDVDICVVDDISELFETELEGLYLAGCRIPAFLKEQTAHFPAELQECYVAGGIWMMNLRQLRKDDVVSNILEIMRKPPFRLIWNDQDVMNLACCGKVGFISYRYCSIPGWRKMLEPIDYVDCRYPDDALREAIYRPKIVHYAFSKPWSGPCEGGRLWDYWCHRAGFPMPSVHGAKGAEPGFRREWRISEWGIYFLKHFRLPWILVRLVRRDDVIIVKILGFLFRVRLRILSDG